MKNYICYPGFRQEEVMTGSTSSPTITTTTATAGVPPTLSVSTRGVPSIHSQTAHPYAADFNTNLYSPSKIPGISQNQDTLNTIFKRQNLLPCEPETLNLIPETLNSMPETLNPIPEILNSMPNIESGSASHLSVDSSSSHFRKECL